ncbi:26808_t:CDS:2, partial [Gigaspora margarita]
GTFAKVINNIEDTLEDWELFEITHNTLQDYALKAIEWHKKANKKLKSTFYTDKGKAPAQSYYENILAQSYHKDILAQSKQQMQRIENQLVKSQPYEVQRLTSVFHYFRLLLNGERKIQALEQIADNLWKDIQNTEYMSHCIRGWAKDFLEQGTLPSHQQGKHAKRASLLDDEDIKLAAYIWLRSILPKDQQQEQYDDDNMENVIPPEQLEIWDTCHVLVTYDKVYFYANNDNSSFGEDMVKQLREKAIPIFNALHPSTNYNAHALNALMCSRMTLYPKVEKKFKFKDSWFIHNYEKTVQPMFFLDEKDSTVKFKGIKKILEERNMWTGQRLDCKRKEDDEK